MRQRYVTRLEEIRGLDPDQRAELEAVTSRYAFRANAYYLSLINWDDPFDPIRRVIMPHADELEDWGQLDPSNERKYTVLPGLEHKYNSTALLLVSDTCGGICRYCFRKRVFMHREGVEDLDAAMAYIRRHKEITNVLLTGGDPLILPTAKLDEIIGRLRTIDHVGIIRIGSKLPAFDPHRIVDDPSLAAMLARHSTARKRIYVMTHFNHPRELTDVAVRAVDAMLKAGAILTNQTPLIRGVNDDPYVLADLFKELSFIGVPPYYVFQCRPTVANRCYAVPIEEGYQIFEQAKSMVSGLAKRARFVMSHATGKMEILAMSADHIYFKYLRAADDADSARVVVFERDPFAYWLDDYEHATEEHGLDTSYAPNWAE